MRMGWWWGGIAACVAAGVCLGICWARWPNFDRVYMRAGYAAITLGLAGFVCGALSMVFGPGGLKAWILSAVAAAETLLILWVMMLSWT
jgi:hypothetical protein